MEAGLRTWDKELGGDGGLPSVPAFEILARSAYRAGDLEGTETLCRQAIELGIGGAGGGVGIYYDLLDQVTLTRNVEPLLLVATSTGPGILQRRFYQELPRDWDHRMVGLAIASLAARGVVTRTKQSGTYLLTSGGRD